MRITFSKASIYVILCTALVTGCTKIENNMPNIGNIFNKKNNNNTLPHKPIANSYNNVPVTPPAKKQDYKVALFLPTKSSDDAIKKVARDLLGAAYLAKQELNESKMSLLVYETDGTSASDISAAQDAVAKKIDLILGPLLANSVTAIRPITEPARIPMLAFSSDYTVVKGGYSYLLSYLLDQNVSAVAQYALSQGHKNFGFYGVQSVYGNRVSEVFSKSISDGGGTVTNSVLLSPNAPDFHIKTKEFTEIETLRSQDSPQTSYSALMLPDNAAVLTQLVPSLTQYNLDFKSKLILGTGVWHEDNILNIAELNGAVFAAPDHNKTRIFENRFMQKYGVKPAQIASLAYDGVGLVAALIKQYPNDAFAISHITDPNGFLGVGGVFRFLPNGMSQRGLNILRIKDGTFQVVLPASDTFVGQ